MPRVADVSLLWTKSPSLDIAKVKVHLTINDGPEIVNELSPEIETFKIVLPAVSSASFKIESIDAEDRVAMSEQYDFGVGDLTDPLPATDLGHRIDAIRDTDQVAAAGKLVAGPTVELPKQAPKPAPPPQAHARK